VRENAGPLEDFPLHGEVAENRIAPPPAREPEPNAPLPAAGLPPDAAAPLSARWSAAAADGATVLLLTAIAILAARVLTGESPRVSGIGWAIGFAVYLSLFATVPALVLFGKTVGMALADLSARSPSGGGLSAPAALLRWLGTLATAAAAGLPLLLTASRPQAPTLADRLSGHALTLD
jgi:hypothetical protein